MEENLSEHLRRRRAALTDELTRQSHPVAVLPGLLRDFGRPWPADYDPKDFRESVFPRLTQLHQNFDEARSVRDGWTSTIASLTREAEALKVKLTTTELENPDHERDLAKHHLRKTEIETYKDALAQLVADLLMAEREWERVKPTVETQVERYADLLFEQERYSLQKEVEELLTKAATVRVHAAELSPWHHTVQERFGLTITPRRVTFDPALPTAQSYEIKIEKGEG